MCTYLFCYLDAYVAYIYVTMMLGVLIIVMRDGAKKERNAAARLMRIGYVAHSTTLERCSTLPCVRLYVTCQSSFFNNA